MASIKSAAQRQENLSNIVNSVNAAQSAVEDFYGAVSASEEPVLVASAMDSVTQEVAEAVQEQQNLNNAVGQMGIAEADADYRKLSKTAANTKQNVSDNVNEQKQSNSATKEGGKSSKEQQSKDFFQTLQDLRKNPFFTTINGVIKSARECLEECFAAFDVQNNAELQLFSALANNSDEELVSQFESQLTAELAVDTSQAVNDINGIQDEVGEVTVSVAAKTQAVTAAFDEITEKASEIQSRGIYSDEVMISAAAEFSTYFSDTDAITVMMDTLTNYAAGMSGGGAVGASGMVSYAADLGQIKSGSYDVMTENGFKFTDVQKAIIEGEATREQIVAALGEEYVEMSGDMQAAAVITQVVDEAWAGLYENVSGMPQGKIIQLTNAWNGLKEMIGQQLYPYIVRFVDIIMENWPTIESVVQGIINAFQIVLEVLSWIMQAVFSIVNATTSDCSTVGAQIEAVATALGLAAAAYGAYQVAVGVAELAQSLFDSTLWTSPLTWIIIIIIAVIAAIYGMIAAINSVTGSTISATGAIMGALAAAGAFVWNVFLGILELVLGVIKKLVNPLIAFGNFFGNIFTDPIGAIIHLFGDLADTALSVLQAIASAIDFIFGSGFADTVQGWRDGLKDMVDSAAKKYGNGQYEEVMSALDVSVEDLGLKRIAYEDAWNAGYEFGESIDEFDPSSIFSGMNENKDLLDQMGEQNELTDDIYGNTDDIAGAMEISEEDLKCLRDIAEQEAINRFTTAEITIEQTNNNNISSALDLDGVMDGLTDAVNEAAVIIAEGVHV